MPGPIATWFASLFPAFEGVAPVTVRQADPDTGATVRQSVGVAAYKKGGTDQAIADLGGGGLGAARAAQFRLLAADLDFEPEVLDQIVEADGQVWQVRIVAGEVVGTYRVCQCVRVN